MPCGSTIGPILSSLLGCRTVDVGAPMLSMHSIREMCGTDDVDIGYNHFVAFFEEISKVATRGVCCQPCALIGDHVGAVASPDGVCAAQGASCPRPSPSPSPRSR
jgi:hypothetical protein